LFVCLVSVCLQIDGSSVTSTKRVIKRFHNFQATSC